MNQTNKTHVSKYGRVNIATVVAMALLSACSGPIPVPIQTAPQQKSEPSFVDRLRDLLPGRAPAQPKVEPVRAPETYPPAVWPAPGAGDYPPGWYLPKVVWPPPGTEVVAQPASLPPLYWHTVGVDERELIPFVAAPASIRAGEDVHDRHPSLLGAAAANPKAYEELRDLHPQLFAGWPRVNLLAIELLNGPEPSPKPTQADGAEPKDDMFYQHPSRGER